MPEDPSSPIPQKASALKNRWVQACILAITLQVALFICAIGSVSFLYHLPEQEMARLDNPEIAPNNVDNYQFKSVEDFNKAETKLKKLVSSPEYRDKPIIHYLMGCLYQAEGRNKKATRHFAFASKPAVKSILHMYQYETYVNLSFEQLGLIDYKDNRYKRALKNLKTIPSESWEALEKPLFFRHLLQRLEEPERADHHWLLAQDLTAALEFPHARKELKEAIRLSKDPHLRIEAENYLKTELPKGTQDLTPMTRYYMLAGNAAEDDERPQDAIAFYKKALEEAPNFEWAHQQLAVLYRQTGNTKLANKHANEGLRTNPDFYQALLTLGDLALDREDFAAALKHYETAKAILTRYPLDENTPMLANLENQLGYTQESLHALAPALSHYEQALNIARSNPDDEDDDFQYAEEAIARIQRQQTIQQKNQLAGSDVIETTKRLSTLQY